METDAPPVFRFAPSPNGALHLGHAYSALLNHGLARRAGGRFLLRIEDIDLSRCKPELEEQMLEDLLWLGVDWDEEPRRQSDHFAEYAEGLDLLRDAGLVYPSFLSRGQIRDAVARKRSEGIAWPDDPDGAPLYPGEERSWPEERRADAVAQSASHALRLDMGAALNRLGSLDLVWEETGAGPDGETGEIQATPEVWGDVVLARSDTPTSYHLSVVIDDAVQGVTHVVRGRDLFQATSVHRVLQVLLGLPAPSYCHHDLIMGEDGRKLSKSQGDTSLRALRGAGMTPQDVKRLIGFNEEAIARLAM